jgi:hypothetical protein
MHYQKPQTTPAQTFSSRYHFYVLSCEINQLRKDGHSQQKRTSRRFRDEPEHRKTNLTVRKNSLSPHSKRVFDELAPAPILYDYWPAALS